MSPRWWPRRVSLWPRAPFRASDRLARLERYVVEHVREPITAADAARLLHLERRYFSKFFRRRVGMTFSDWRRRVRVARAVHLLRTTGKPIPVVAHESGFSTARSLQRAFRTLLGETPTAHRDAYRRELDEPRRLPASRPE